MAANLNQNPNQNQGALEERPKKADPTSNQNQGALEERPKMVDPNPNPNQNRCFGSGLGSGSASGPRAPSWGAVKGCFGKRYHYRTYTEKGL